MRYLLLVLLFSGLPVLAQGSKAAVAQVLDDFHEAASKADATSYFGYFSKEAVFLGTDIKERWTVEEFRAYAMPYFQKGQGWTYRPTSRHVYLSEDGQTAWFDEILHNQKYGNTRGTGVLVKSGGDWKISQYHLTLPVPNDLMPDVVRMIEAQRPSP